MHVGASLGMAPRFSTGHLATHNHAIAGVRKSFTSLPDEFLFIDENTRGILALQRAADALVRIVPVGVSSPVADTLFEAAQQALRDVLRFNERLFATLDVQRFFYSVRPYYKPYRVGRQDIAAPTPATSPASTKSTCCSACAAPATRTTRSCWSTRCCSCCRRTRRDCATA